MGMTSVTERAADAARLPRGASRVVCPACETACAVPAGARLADTGCVACLEPLAPSPRTPPRALRHVAAWCDRTRVPGPGYGMVVCPHCGLECLVPVGAALAAKGCIGCFRLLGARPLVRHDLPPPRPERDPWDEPRLLPCAAPPDLRAVA